MSPVLYMSPLSPPSRAVLMTAEAIGLELELKNVDLIKRENHDPEYIKLNSLHTVPTLVDNDVIIADSHAINSYLVGKYAKNDDLYPGDFAKRAIVDQRLFFDAERCFSLFRNTVAPLFLGRSKIIPEEETKKILEHYKLLETFLERGDWISGEQVTIADFSLMTSTTALDLLLSLDSELFPKTANWLQRMESLPWAKVNQLGLEELKKVIEKCKS